jgi:hypothetical protein
MTEHNPYILRIELEDLEMKPGMQSTSPSQLQMLILNIDLISMVTLETQVCSQRQYNDPKSITRSDIDELCHEFYFTIGHLPVRYS